MANSCILYPMINDKPSKLYKDLLKLIGNRPKTNYIYAVYLQPEVAAEMDRLGYKRNEQNEHSSTDVEKYLDVMNYMRESTEGKVYETSKRIGAIDASGNPINYTDAKKALEIAEQHNSNSKGTVAAVYSKGSKFNIVVEEKNSRTQIRDAQVSKQLQQWDILRQAINSIGIDIENADLNKAVFNATNAKNAAKQMINVQNTSNKYLDRNEIKDLLVFNESSSQVKRLKQMFGSLNEVAQKIYDCYRSGGVTDAQYRLIDAALNNCKKFNGLNLNDILNQLNKVDTSFSDVEEVKIRDTLKALNKKYNLDFNEILLIGNNIRSLSQAASNAAITLQRQLKKLRAEQGFTPEVDSMEKALRTLVKEINRNKYYAGILGFLSEAATQIRGLEKLLINTPQTGATLERSSAIAKTLMQIKATTEGYRNILMALSNIDSLVMDEKLSDADIQNIKTQATKLLNFFNKYDTTIKELRKETMTNIAIEYLGDKLSNGEAIVNIVEMAEKDSTIFDYLYSIGRVSNPLIATMGNIVRDAQSSRDAKINNISLRIRRAENKLKKAGFRNDFMYEDNGYIISDIDWDTYNKAKAKQKKRLQKQGYKGLSLSEALKDWEAANTENRVVDYNSGRTERVPNNNYRKEFPTLSPEQQEYYSTMMQIKGELGTLLPSYAQKQYIPPQIRRSFIDALSASIKKGSIRGLIKAFRNKFKDYTTIREDDERYANNGIINGENYNITSGELDNTPFRQIPIFYINKLKDKEELLKDFSSAIQHLAGTAINYEAINNIKDTVEFMADYIKNQEVSAGNGNKKVDKVEDAGIKIYKQLRDFASNSNTIGIVDGFIDKFIYGVSIKNPGKYHIFLRNLLAYTSLKSLAVNVKGMISNYTVGELQMLIESGAAEFFNPVDYIWANAMVFGDNTIRSVGRIMDFMTNNTNSKPVLLSQMFDPLNDNFESKAHQRYYRGPLRHLLGKDFSFIGYGMGEHMIHFVTMYAILHNTKVKINGKTKSLYDVFSIGNKSDGNSELIINKDATYTNDEGKEVPIDDAFIEKIRKRIRYTNQTMHGAMNEEDKGLIHQHMVGRFVMNLRQWMVEHYSRRYRSSHYDATLGEFREGFYNTSAKFVYALVGDIFRFQRESMIHWKDMNTMQKANVKRALSELVVLSSLLTLSFALGEPEDHKKEWWMRMWIYQTKRAITDVNGSTPIGIPLEATTLINSPIAATNTVNSFLYPIVGIGDIDEEIKSGKHKGENRYFRNIKKYLIPFYGQIEQLSEMGTDDSMFKIFEKNNLQK